jgi:hypothetical protein
MWLRGRDRPLRAPTLPSLDPQAHAAQVSGVTRIAVVRSSWGKPERVRSCTLCLLYFAYSGAGLAISRLQPCRIYDAPARHGKHPTLTH